MFDIQLSDSLFSEIKVRLLMFLLFALKKKTKTKKEKDNNFKRIDGKLNPIFCKIFLNIYIYLVLLDILGY